MSKIKWEKRKIEVVVPICPECGSIMTEETISDGTMHGKLHIIKCNKCGKIY